MADDQLQPAPASLERGRLRKAPENFIDRAGVVTDVHVGVPDEDWLDGRVRALLSP